MTTKELNLITRLRNKMGDNPTISDNTFNITDAVCVNGIVTITTLTELSVKGVLEGMHVTISNVKGMTDLNESFVIQSISDKTFTVALSTSQIYLSGGNFYIHDYESQVWTDAEYLDELTSARVTCFKGKVSDLENLTPFEEEVVLLSARASFCYTLATDSTKYAVYNLRDTGVKKTSPEEFINMAKAFERKLDKLIEDGSETESLGPTVQEGRIHKYDRQRDLIVPVSTFNLPPKIPFLLENSSDGVLIKVRRLFYTSYRDHFIKKIPVVEGTKNNSYGDVLYNWDKLQDFTLLDEDVSSGATYRYTMYSGNINGDYSIESKEITYAE